MDNNKEAFQKTILQNGNVQRIDNAFIEEIYISSQRTGYVLISYGAEERKNWRYRDFLRLNVGKDTQIMNQFGESLCLCDLEKGITVAAEFSPAMTRSIPPQARAFSIIANTVAPDSIIKIDRVVSIDDINGFFITGNPYDINDQMIFTVSEETFILDQNYNQISLNEIQPGQSVMVEHAIFQTLSIPPQSPAFLIQLL
ncbi:hypothetical protein [Anaerocolumna sp. MB42-C2]|uniref:hypothetical protein n=1 Tax=Anaerocolumna sp. MB42-C2 TaxID=3070997 RepID=UPI0027DFA79E|nr:hypothetical protein [Anaerocolumna sp. MB42-C2]WMJ88162.1 hypothetical protein RBU59_01265 [Anaerocolumna sp. MB42-C2]